MELVCYYLLLSSLIPLAMYYQRYNSRKKMGTVWSKYLIFSLVITIILKGIVYNTGVDFYHYYEYYQSVVNNQYDSWGEHTEWGYRMLVRCLSTLNDSPVVFFVVSAFVVFYSMTRAAQYYEHAAAYIMMLWWPYMNILSLNLYRQYYAISFLMLAYIEFRRRNYIGLALFVLAALFFHTSSIIPILTIIVLYFLSSYKINKWYFIGATIVTSLSSQLLMNQIAGLSDLMAAYYFDQTGQLYDSLWLRETFYDTSVLIYPNLLTYIVFIWVGDKYCETRPAMRFLFYIFVLSLILFPITRQEILSRLCFYFVGFSPLFLGCVLAEKTFRANKLFILCLFYQYVYYVYSLILHEYEFPLKFDHVFL